jgi:ABC-type transporter Mla MlaB component
MMMTAFWNMAPCSLIEVNDVSEVRTASFALMIEVIRTSETQVYFYETTRRHIP